MFCVLVTFCFQLSLLASSNVKRRAECVSLYLPVQSLSFDKSYVRRYWKLGTLRPQAELQGLGGGLPPDMQYAGPPVSGICPGAHEPTPAMGQIVPLPCGHLVDRKG